MSMTERIRIREESMKRIGSLAKGDRVTNVCAGERGRYGTFWRIHTVSRKNKYGIVHTSVHARVRLDHDGKLHDICPDVIYPGRLASEECKRLFEPVWEAQFGKR